MTDSKYIIKNSPRLSDLSPRQCGRIVAMNSEKDLERLKAMGLCVGRTLEVLKAGDPLIVRVYGTRIGLSARMAKHIRIQPCEKALRCWERSASDG